LSVCVETLKPADPKDTAKTVHKKPSAANKNKKEKINED